MSRQTINLCWIFLKWGSARHKVASVLLGHYLFKRYYVWLFLSATSIRDYQLAASCGFANTKWQTIISAARCKPMFFLWNSKTKYLRTWQTVLVPMVCQSGCLGSINILFCNVPAGVKMTLFSCSCSAKCVRSYTTRLKMEWPHPDLQCAQNWWHD